MNSRFSKFLEKNGIFLDFCWPSDGEQTMPRHMVSRLPLKSVIRVTDETVTFLSRTELVDGKVRISVPGEGKPFLWLIYEPPGRWIDQPERLDYYYGYYVYSRAHQLGNF